MDNIILRKKYLQCGIVVGTHGIQGGIRVESWCDSPDILAGLDKVYIKKEEDYFPVKIKSSFTKKNIVILFLNEVDSVESAIKFKGVELYAQREDISEDRDVDFIADLIGMNVFDFKTGRYLGELNDVVIPCKQQLYVIKKESGNTFMVPAVPDFIRLISYGDELSFEINGECSEKTKKVYPAGIYINMIEGLDQD